ncbi:PREDICTED: uncharacterized protein LOC108570434 [Habropoda laboriosa]|uniref:uncharacterized protein LOC108570434 n=1 Tax=Habropoda laboriosa TaxID=597456 RepID=UPI00083CAB5C|nr:PREDICTED: uncharacterized protein LOC108570434 [Habropoda laboriosa]
MEDKLLNKYLSNDEVFKAINKRFISLKDNEVERINVYLQQVVETLIERMKLKDSLFNKTYNKIVFCGSFYKGTKVERPNEFDLNIILHLPINYNYVKLCSTLPAFIKIHIVVMELPDQNKLLMKDGYEVKIKVKKSGPAFTIILNIPHEIEDIHIDLAPALVFNVFMIQQFTTKFGILADCRNKECFAIPVPLNNINFNGTRDHWRLSFFYQESEILRKCGSVKPVIRQMKKLRDVQNWKSIASYYIETLFYHKCIELEDLDTMPSTLILFTMLKELYNACNRHQIKYFWNENYNLLEKIRQEEMSNITYRLNKIIKDIEKNIMNDSFILAKYILCPPELQILKEEINSITQSENLENLQNAIVNVITIFKTLWDVFRT